MKEILDALKTKFEGVSESVLRITAKNLSAKGKGVEDVESVTLQQVIDAHADHRATEAAKTAREKAEAGQNAAQQPSGGHAHGEDDMSSAEEAPAWAKAILDGQKANAEAIARLQGEKIVAARTEKVKALIAKLPEELQAPYTVVPIDTMDDQAFEAYIEKITPQVEAIAVTLKAQAATGEPGAAGGAPSTGVSDAMKARLERMEKEAETQAPAVIGLETTK